MYVAARKGIKISVEMRLDQSSNDPYLHNWNTEGFVSKIVWFPEIRKNRFNPRFYATLPTPLQMYDGPWLQEARKATYIDIRQDPDCRYCLMPVSDNETVRAVRVVDWEAMRAPWLIQSRRIATSAGVSALLPGGICRSPSRFTAL